ncbi:OmpH family outer membrane protein [Phocaeicola abscessus]|uniref:OmpH family outer membrane protein n=1 Tax=Phocaeicola abscessus TaxID=555313 RepID=UPI00038696E2|nr:OmpH family outer membrane protein [Phocaeicola abscessus]EPT33317.1 outer membrane protein, OmpH-like protein [Bacteroidetes bacterium oral taxon 272 str. F0290]
MKTKNVLIKGFFAAAIMLPFTQCANNRNKADVPPVATAADEVAPNGNLKIAYVEIDSLLSKYNFCKDLNELMLQKEENIRTTLNEKAKRLDADAREWERKVQNNGFASQERAQQEQQRILKQQQDLQQQQQRLSDEFAAMQQKNNLELRDSISSFLKEYNKTKNYDLIFSNSGLDNLLYAKQAFNITDEIVKGLNARYISKKK